MPHKKAKHSQRQANRFSTGNDLAPPSGGDDWHFGGMPKGAMRILQGAKIQEEFNKKRQQRKDAGLVEDPNNPQSKGKKKAASVADELKLLPGEKLGEFNRRVERTMAHEISQTFRSESRASINARKRARRAARKAGIDPDAEEEEVKEEDRKKRADKAAAKQAAEPSSSDLKKQRQAIETTGEVKDFAKASQVKKINDVAQTPPKLTKAPRGESVPSKLRKAQLMAKIGGTDEEEASRSVLNAEKARFKGRMPVKAPAQDKKRKRADDEPAKPVKTSMARQMILDQERDKAIKAYRELKEQKIKDQDEKRIKKK